MPDLFSEWSPTIQQMTSSPAPPGTILPEYKVEVRDKNGTLLIEAPFKALQYSYVINGPGSIDFEVPTLHPDVTFDRFHPVKREVRVLRDGVRVWGGYIWNVGGEGDMVRVNGDGYFSRFNHLVVEEDKIFTPDTNNGSEWDAAQIAKELLQYGEAKTGAAINITYMTPYPDSNTDRRMKYRFWERRNIGESVEELASTNPGFDWEISPTKEWRIFVPRKGGASGKTFTLGVNVPNLSMSVTSDQMANRVHAIGAGEKNRTCIAVVVDSASRTEYGLMEGVADFDDIKHFDTLAKHATRLLNHNVRPRWTPQLAVYTNDPPWGEYVVGDTATVVANHGWLTVNGTFRIIAITVHVADPGHEAITVQFSDRLVP